MPTFSSDGQNVFTLTLLQRPNNPLLIDLVDENGTPHYRKQRVPGNVYKIELVEPLSESVLSTATAPSPTNKHKTIELYNPNLAIDLKYSGTLSTRWKFKWEDHEFEWKKEECYIIRKPDPAVLVAITKEPTSRVRSWTVQILDYNLNRFDIEDRKGLEIVILTALLTFGDASDATHVPADDPPPYTDPAPSSYTSPPATNADEDLTQLAEFIEMPPTPPPRPAPKTGIDRIAEMQAMRDEVNEVTVDDEGHSADYAQYCYNLLQDEAMLFITVRSANPEQVTKVLHVVEEAKRLRYLAGNDEQQLHQYVVYDTKPVHRKGPRIINLDYPPSTIRGKGNTIELYQPPTSLMVHLSKIPMPELQPTVPQPQSPTRAVSNAYPTPDHSPKDKSPGGKGKENVDKGKGKEKEVPKESSKERKKREKLEKEEREREKKEQEEHERKEKEVREREKKEREKREKESLRQKEKRQRREREQERKENEEKEKREKKGREERERREKKEREKDQGRLAKHRSASAGNIHVHSHETHPFQPSPSPAQLNNPGIYMAPPPRAPRPPAALHLNLQLPAPRVPVRPTTLCGSHTAWSGGSLPRVRRLSSIGISSDLYDAFNIRRT